MSLYEGAQRQLKESIGAVAMLLHRIAQLGKLIFGSKHKRFVPTNTLPDQLALDLQADAPCEVNVAVTQKIEYTGNETPVE